MFRTVPKFETLATPTHADQHTCFQFIDDLIQYVRKYRFCCQPPLERLDGSQTYSKFGSVFLNFVVSGHIFPFEQRVSYVVAECRRIPVNQPPVPILRFVNSCRYMLEEGSKESCFVFLAYLCKLCLELEDYVRPELAMTAVAFAKSLIARHPKCFQRFLWMRNQA